MRKKALLLALLIAALPLPALAANDVAMLVSPVGIATMLVAAVIGFGVGKYFK